MTYGAPDGYIVAAPVVVPVMLLYLQTGDKLWIRKGPNSDYNRRNIPVYDMDIP
jgi:hypothetical protein